MKLIDTIELTIDSRHFGKWGLWEGLRDLVQNAKDEEERSGIPHQVIFHAETAESQPQVIIRNPMASLSRRVLLLGNTTKEGDPKARGRFGEGLKAAMLALLRLGYPITVDTGTEILKPEIRQSERFEGSTTLHVDVLERAPNKPTQVDVVVSGITKQTWKEVVVPFVLFYNRTPKGVQTSYGRVLLSKRFSGKVFCKGVLVGAFGYRLGYDFNEIEVDRDRNMVNVHQCDSVVAKILTEAIVSAPTQMTHLVYELLENGSRDIYSFGWSSSDIEKAAKASLAEVFKTKHGTKALPVHSVKESELAKRLGYKGVVLSSGLHSAISSFFSDERNVLSAKYIIKRRYAFDDLTTQEQTALTKAVALLGAVYEPMNLNRIQVVKFQSLTGAEYAGANESNGSILLAKNVLSSVSTCLETLVHEAAHDHHREDLTEEHTRAIERLWQKIVASFLGE